MQFCFLSGLILWQPPVGHVPGHRNHEELLTLPAWLTEPTPSTDPTVPTFTQGLFEGPAGLPAGHIPTFCEMVALTVNAPGSRVQYVECLSREE